MNKKDAIVGIVGLLVSVGILALFYLSGFSVQGVVMEFLIMLPYATGIAFFVMIFFGKKFFWLAFCGMVIMLVSVIACGLAEYMIYVCGSLVFGVLILSAPNLRTILDNKFLQSYDKKNEKKEKVSGGLSNIWDKLDMLEEQDASEDAIDEVFEELEDFAKQVGHGKKSIFLHTLKEKYYQVIKTNEGYAFHFVGDGDIVQSKCFPASKYITESSLQDHDFIVKHNKIKKIIYNAGLDVWTYEYNIIKFKLKWFARKKYVVYTYLDDIDYKAFFGEKLTIKNEGQSILERLERDAMERIQNENNANE